MIYAWITICVMIALIMGYKDYKNQLTDTRCTYCQRLLTRKEQKHKRCNKHNKKERGK